MEARSRSKVLMVVPVLSVTAFCSASAKAVVGENYGDTRSNGRRHSPHILMDGEGGTFFLFAQASGAALSARVSVGRRAAKRPPLMLKTRV